MSELRVAFLGMGQTYPSHVWMRRMRDMLAESIVVNIDDGRNQPKRRSVVASDDRLPHGTKIVPRKVPRVSRWMESSGITQFLGNRSRTNEQHREEWMLGVIEQSKANVVFVHFVDYAIQFERVWRRLDIPILVHAHGYDIVWDVCNERTGERLHPSDYLARVSQLPSNVHFIANSNFTRDQLLAAQINPNRIRIKRFGVPVSHDPPLIDLESCSLLFLGRLVDFKGPVETTEAFSKIVKGHPEWQLDIAGDGVLRQAVDAKCSSLGLTENVNMHGAVDLKKGDELRRAAAVFTAHNQIGPRTRQREAFGVALIEAMAEGVPVVTGRCGGLVDFIESGVNGFLFEPGDIQHHAELIERLILDKDLRRRMSLAAWETIRENHQLDHERVDLLGFLQDLVNDVKETRVAA
ncbi:MAG: glycosyltransferase [Planctomycetota bacterium]